MDWLKRNLEKFADLDGQIAWFPGFCSNKKHIHCNMVVYIYIYDSDMDDE